MNFQHSTKQGRASTPLPLLMAAKVTTKHVEEFYFCFTRYPSLGGHTFSSRLHQTLLVSEAARVSPQQLCPKSHTAGPSHTLTGPAGIMALNYYRLDSD